MTTISENYYQNRYENCDGAHWRRYVTAPRYVKRPFLGERYAYYYFGSNHNKDMETLWQDIQWATKCGYLGYCGGYSNNHKLIAIHISDPTETLLDIIKDNLRELGVRKMTLKFKDRHVLHYSELDYINGCDENSFEFSEQILFQEFQELQQNREKYY